MNANLLNGSIFHRSLSDTASAFKTIRFYVFVLIVDAVTAIAIYLLRHRLYESQGASEIPIPFGVFMTVVPLIGGSFVGLTLLFLFSIVLASYRQRNEARAFAYQLLQANKENDLTTTRIEVTPFTGEGMAQLRVTNLGTATLKCQAEMRKISPEPSKPESLPYAIRWKGNNSASNVAGLTEIVGGGSRVLEVARHSSSSNASRIASMYLLRADGDDRRFTVSTKFNEEVICEIAILCEPPLAKSQIDTYAILDNGEQGIVGFRKLELDERPMENG